MESREEPRRADKQARRSMQGDLLATTLKAGTNAVTARGGTAATNCGGPGGNGGVGRIRLDATTLEGTTTPVAFLGSP